MLLNRDRALAIMEAEGLDVLVATAPENTLYLSDYSREFPFLTIRDFNAVLFPRDESVAPVLFIQEMEVPAFADEWPTWIAELRVQTSGYVVIPEHLPGERDRRIAALMEDGRRRGGPYRLGLIVKTLEELGLAGASIGIDEIHFLPLYEQAGLDVSRVRDAGQVLRDIRLVKTSEEVSRMRAAAAAVERGLLAVADMIGEGVSPAEIRTRFRSEMLAQGGYGSQITWGGGERAWNGERDFDYRYKPGDVVYVDPAGSLDHYWSDVGRAAHIGPPTDKFTDHFGVLQELHAEVVPTFVPGETFASIGERTHAASAGRLPGGIFALTHSIGLEQYDHPHRSDAFGGGAVTLEPGMTINFETGYMELGWGILHLEDTYLITDGAPERITSVPLAPIHELRTAGGAA